MSAVLALQPGDVRLTLSPEVASRVVLDWLQGREAQLELTVERLEAFADTLQPGWRQPLADADDSACATCGAHR